MRKINYKGETFERIEGYTDKEYKEQFSDVMLLAKVFVGIAAASVVSIGAAVCFDIDFPSIFGETTQLESFAVWAMLLTSASFLAWFGLVHWRGWERTGPSEIPMSEYRREQRAARKKRS